MITLGKITPHRGQNSVIVKERREEDGVLSLLLADSADESLPRRMLGTAKPPRRVYLRKEGDVLSWCDEKGGVFLPLCAVDSRDILLRLAEATGIGRSRDVCGRGVILTVKGNELRFRATDWREGKHICHDAMYSAPLGNRHFDFHSIREVDADMPVSEVVTGVSFKGMIDDIAPLHLNGGYIAGNHGFSVIAALPNTAKKTERDVGSVWKNADGVTFVLVRATDEAVWLCPFSETSMQSGRFSYVAIKEGEVLTAVRGAADPTPITATADSKRTQLHPSVNHVTRAAFLEGETEVDLGRDGIYTAEFIDLYERYDVIYLPPMLAYLMENAGACTNESYWLDRHERALFTVEYAYRIEKNGACVVFCRYEFHKDVDAAIVAGVQSIPMGGDHYVYVPGTKHCATPRLQHAGEEIDISAETDLVDPERLPTSYFQFTDPAGSRSMNLGYVPGYGYADPSLRRRYLGEGVSNLGFYATTYKMYPKLLANTKLPAGEVIDFIAYRIPGFSTDPDFTAINHYTLGDDIYLQLHTAGGFAHRTVALPAEMNGRRLLPLDVSSTLHLTSETVEKGRIALSADGPAYGIYLLRKA
ncbi:MAG: hypothetical protein IKC73_03170 [Clostridia bacterium]|nr:hypothetical protein [Clostridia bacterium]